MKCIVTRHYFKEVEIEAEDGADAINIAKDNPQLFENAELHQEIIDTVEMLVQEEYNGKENN